MTKPNYQPSFIGDQAVSQEFRRLAETLNSLQLNKWELAYSEPAKPRQGVVYIADGTNWDPLSAGEMSPVWFDGTDWKALGGGGGAGPQGPQGDPGPTGPQGPQGPEASPIVEINLQTGATYTLVSGDAGKCIERDSASANTVTVPSGIFAVGMQLQIRQVGAGATTIVAGSGVTIQTPSTLELRAQWATVALHQRATDEWVAMGDLL